MSDSQSFHAATSPLLKAPWVPGDKSISHRALLLSALANGRSELYGLSQGEDVVCTKRAIKKLGAIVEGSNDDVVVVQGFGNEPKSIAKIDCGNSGTAMRLLSGMCAGFDGEYEFDGDVSLRSRPMDRIADPLREMGASIDGFTDAVFPQPLRIKGGGLHGIAYGPPMASAQVKGAVLFAGISADGDTIVHERQPTRRHTEEMFAASGIDISVSKNDIGNVVTVRRSRPNPMRWDIALDPSQVAFWVVAAILVPGSSLTFENVYLGEERIGFLRVLERMGADVTFAITNAELSTGQISASHSSLRATTINEVETASVIDEIPILSIAASCAEGTSTFLELSELRVKESDRLETTTQLIGALGGNCVTDGDDLHITGVSSLAGGEVVTTHGDHRIAMSAAIGGLICEKPVTIAGWRNVNTSYLGFAEELAQWQ